MENWWDNLEGWVKILICIVGSIISLALIVPYDNYANRLELQIPHPIVSAFVVHPRRYSYWRVGVSKFI